MPVPGALRSVRELLPHAQVARARAATLAIAPDVLLSGVRRLRLLAWVLTALFASGGLAIATMRLLGVQRPAWMDASALAVFVYRVSWLQVAGVVLAGAMIAITRIRRLAPRRILGVGVVFQLLGALLFSAADFLVPWPADPTVMGLPHATLWIMAFPLIPANRRRSMIAAFGAASTGPLAFALYAALGRPMPAASTTVMFYLPLFAAAGVTALVSRILHGLAIDASSARRLGSYSLVEKIAEGGMGEVWKARHASLIRPAAVKLIRPEYLGRRATGEMETIVRRFEREAQMTALLSSPHTVVLYDFGRSAEGIIYYVMELLGGVDLEKLVEAFGPLPAERAVYILRQVCHSLADAHRVNLVHRDVKPGNVQLTVRGGDYDFVKVLDFGLAKRRDVAATPRADGGHVVVGTAAYLSPEAALEPDEVDAQSDVYSLGCAAYYLLTGRFVFEATTSRALILEHIGSDPVPVSRRSELPIPRELDELILEMLAKQPSARPAGAAEVDRRLAAIPFDEPWTQQRAEAWWRAHLPEARGREHDELPSTPALRRPVTNAFL